MPTRGALAAPVLAALLALTAGNTVSAADESAGLKAQEAASALLRGNPEQAVAAYTSALQDATLANDRRAAILNDRGVAYSRMGQHKLALDDYNRAVQLFPEYAPVYNNRGNTLMTLGHPQEAIKDFDRAIALAPGYAVAYNNRAGALARAGQSAQAVKDYTRAVSLMPQNTTPLTGRGRVHLALGRPYAALRDFSRAIGVDARAGPAYQARAEAALEVEKYEEAIEDFSRAIAFEPNNAALHVLRGHAYLMAANPSSAIRDFTRALEIDPRSARALAGRGLALSKADAFEEAEADLARAIEIDPRSAEAFAYRAWFYKHSGQPDLGVREIEKALRIDANRADVLWAKGEVEHALGRSEEAIASLRKALLLRPAYRDARTALQQLGATPEGNNESVRSDIEGWRILAQNNRYTALLDGQPKLRVPLEMAGDGVPQLIDWELKDGVLKGIGLLRYAAGTVPGRSGEAEVVEQIAIIDLAASQVISLQLHRQGENVSTWTWNDGQVTINSVDGVTDVLVLRTPRPKEVAQRRPVEQRSDDLYWVPWGQGGWGSPAYAPRGGGQPQRRQKPKTLFDLLFGN